MSPMLSRRTVIAAIAATSALPVLPALADDNKFSMMELGVQGPIPDISLGKPDAPVKIYEYASLDCPHCARFNADVFPQIKQKYIDTGKVQWTTREFPLHAAAAAGFMVARCIAKGGAPEKYYSALDLLFARQDEWAFVAGPQVVPSITNIVKQAGFTQDQVAECLKDRELYAGVLAVKDRGEKMFRIDATPTFFINGVQKSGELPVADFSAAIDAQLKS